MIIALITLLEKSGDIITQATGPISRLSPTRKQKIKESPAGIIPT